MQRERIWIIKASFAITGFVFIFFIAAPGVFNFPMEYDESIRIVQIITPVFVGYVGLATAFLFNNPNDTARPHVADDALLRLLLRGPVYFLAGGLAVAISVFWYTNRPSGTPGSGMSIDHLAWFISGFLGMLAASTGLIVAKLFPVVDKK